MKRAGRIILAALALLICVFLGLEAIILVNARSDLRRQSELMIVLGAMVWPDGPSPALRYRIDTALEYLSEHPEMKVIVSGGQGEDEPCSEARAMADALIAAGVSESRIFLEEASFNTRQNLLNSMELMRAMGYDPSETPVVVVSNGFHLARIRMLCARYGLDADTLAAPFPERFAAFYSYCREAPALVKSFLLD